MPPKVRSPASFFWSASSHLVKGRAYCCSFVKGGCAASRAVRAVGVFPS